MAQALLDSGIDFKLFIEPLLDVVDSQSLEVYTYIDCSTPCGLKHFLYEKILRA